MSPLLISCIVVLYFIVLVTIARVSSKNANEDSFFIGNRNSPWMVVAFGMVGASLSGVTFISVPGWVSSTGFSYMQVVLGYLVGYIVIAFVLMPLYYRLQLTSIYEFFNERYGRKAYVTGAGFFLISRILGAAFRLYLVVIVLQEFVTGVWGFPFELTVLISIALIWLYTNKGGIKTIIWTDTFQTAFMLIAVVVTVFAICSQLDISILSLPTIIGDLDIPSWLQFDDVNAKSYFWKQFVGGALIALTMTGMDQDMMQKNLSCKDLKSAQKNMLSFSTVLIFVNLLFLTLGALLFIFAQKNGFDIPERTDKLYPQLAVSGMLGLPVAILFVLGLVAAAYSSADSALTSLTTSFCIDILEIRKKDKSVQEKLRKNSHIGFSLLLFVVIVVFNRLNNSSIIDQVLSIAGYTYGPILGLFMFGILTKRIAQDSWVPFIAIAAVSATFLLQHFSAAIFGNYQIGYELLGINGLLMMLGLYLSSLSTRDGKRINKNGG